MISHIINRSIFLSLTTNRNFSLFPIYCTYFKVNFEGTSYLVVLTNDKNENKMIKYRQFWLPRACFHLSLALPLLCLQMKSLANTTGWIGHTEKWCHLHQKIEIVWCSLPDNQYKQWMLNEEQKEVNNWSRANALIRHWFWISHCPLSFLK